MEETVAKGSFGLKILKILLVILIPLVFLLTVTSLFLKLSGFNVGQEVTTLASNIPVVSSFVKKTQATKPTAQATSGTSAAVSVSDLKQQLADKAKEVATLQKQSATLEKQMSDLKNQMTQAQKAVNQQANATKLEEAKAKATVIAMTYQSMDPGKAAAIFEKMPLQDAANDLNLLSNQTKASIMENLTPDTAAKLTALLAANPYQASTSSTNSNNGTGSP